MRFLTLLIFFGLFGAIHAQNALTLEDCIRLARERNLELQSSQLNVQQAKTNLEEAKASRLPNLNAQTGISYYAGRGIDPTTNDFITETFLSNDVGLNSSVTLFNAGRINHQIKQNQIGLQQSQAQQQQTENDIGLNVVMAFLNIISDQEALNNARSQLEITQKQLDDLKRLIDAGTRAPNDRFDVEVQVRQAEQNVIARENQLRLDYLQLEQFIRWEEDYPLEIVVPDLTQFEDLTLAEYTVQDLFQQAQLTQPIIKAQELGVAQSEIGIRLAKTAYYPSLTANFGLTTRYSDAAREIVTDQQYQSLDVRFNNMPATIEILQEVPVAINDISLLNQWDQNFNYGGGVTLSIPIFNRLATKSSVQRSKVNYELAKIDLERTRDQLKRDVENAFVSAVNAEKSWQATQKSLEATEAAFENMQKRYGVGNATNLELTTSRLNFENAQRDELTARYTFIFNVKVLDFYIGKALKF